MYIYICISIYIYIYTSLCLYLSFSISLALSPSPHRPPPERSGGTGTDIECRTLSQIIAWDDTLMEVCRDYLHGIVTSREFRDVAFEDVGFEQNSLFTLKH